MWKAAIIPYTWRSKYKCHWCYGWEQVRQITQFISKAPDQTTCQRDGSIAESIRRKKERASESERRRQVGWTRSRFRLVKPKALELMLNLFPSSRLNSQSVPQDFTPLHLVWRKWLFYLHVWAWETTAHGVETLKQPCLSNLLCPISVQNSIFSSRHPKGNNSVFFGVYFHPADARTFLILARGLFTTAELFLDSNQLKERKKYINK